MDLTDAAHAPILDVLKPLLADRKFSMCAADFLSQLALTMECQRATLGFLSGERIRICAVSRHYQDVSQPILPEIAAAMDESLLQNTTLVWPEHHAGFPNITFAHNELARRSGVFSVTTVPLAQDGELIGAITLERARESLFDAQQLALLEQLTSHVAPLLYMKYTLDRPFWVRAGATLRRTFAKRDPAQPFWRSPRGIAAGAGVLALLVLFAVPLPVTATGQAHLDPLVQRVISAPIDGYLKEVKVRPGDQVRAGQLLAEFDDGNLLIDKRRLDAEVLQQQNALADAMVKADRTQVAIHSANLDEVNAQKDLVEQEIGLTKLTAPFDGTVVKGELTRLLGTPFKRSDALFTLAQGTLLRVVVDVGERDIEDIKVGQSGKLVLSARPSDHLGIRIARISPVATVTADGQNVFEVEADIDGDAQSLAPGMKGTAKIGTGSAPVALHWFKRAAHALYYFGWSRL